MSRASRLYYEVRACMCEMRAREDFESGKGRDKLECDQKMEKCDHLLLALRVAASDVKVDDEIITYTGKTATTLTGITRGAYNSESKAVQGGVNGAAVSLFDSVENLGLLHLLKGFCIECLCILV